MLYIITGAHFTGEMWLLRIEYDCVFVDKLQGEERKEMIEAIKKVNPKLSFPTLLLGEETVVGFKEARIMEILERR